MLECFQASTYTTADFHSFLTLYFMQNACLLCGQVHELRFHGYVRRLVRSNVTSTNKAILICVIICFSAKATDKQYTKRILPPFVTPECNIGLDNAFEMYRAMPDGRVDYDRASELLGTVCVKTMRRHYLMVVAFTEVAVTLLTKYLALSAPLPPQSGQPQEEPLMFFVSMMQTVCDLEVQRSEKHYDLAPPTLYLHPVYVSRKSRIASNGHRPLNLSSVIGFYFDTS